MEPSFVKLWRLCCVRSSEALMHKCRRKSATLIRGDDRPEVSLSDDVLKEINYGQLYKQYLQSKAEMKSYRALRSNNSFTDEQLDKYINPYLDILERNLTETYSRLMAMAQNQLDMSQDDISVTADEQKMQMCSHIFYDATDTNNP